jgi:hypothetical protein
VLVAKLDGVRAYVATCAEDQHGLTSHNLGILEEHLPGSNRHDRDGRRFNMI